MLKFLLEARLEHRDQTPGNSEVRLPGILYFGTSLFYFACENYSEKISIVMRQYVF